jgi:hypothetical protein
MTRGEEAKALSVGVFILVSVIKSVIVLSCC